MTRSVLLLVATAFLLGCADVTGPAPGRPVYYVDCTETPEDPVCAEPSPSGPPTCTPPLVVWWWYETVNGVETSGWFCGPPPWW